MKGTNIKLIRKLIIKLTELRRISKKLIMMFVDAILIVMVLLGSFSLSLNYWYLPKEVLLQIIAIAPFLAIPIFYSFRLYSSVTRYIGTGTFWSIAQAVTLYAFVWGFFSLTSNHPYMVFLLGVDSNPFAISGIYFEDISRSVIFINWMLALILIGGSRVLVSWIFNDNNLFTRQKKNNVIRSNNDISAVVGLDSFTKMRYGSHFYFNSNNLMGKIERSIKHRLKVLDNTPIEKRNKPIKIDYEKEINFTFKYGISLSIKC